MTAPDVAGPAPDLVFVVRHGEPNDSLRYVLRSMAANVPHATVWIAGYCPEWATGVRHIPVPQLSTKWANSTSNLRAAVTHRDVADRFVFCCDDTFVLRPVDRIPVMHRGPVAGVVADYEARGVGSQYVMGMRATAKLLGRLGRPDPLCYEVHAPLPVDKEPMAEALELAGRVHYPLHKRTLYGAWWQIGGELVEDPKVADRDAKGWPATWGYVSTSAGHMNVGHPVGDLIRALFPDPSPYELPAPSGR